MKDGIYKSNEAYYFVKGDKILMNISSTMYKTSKNFMIGTEYSQPLTLEMEKDFESCYINAEYW